MRANRHKSLIATALLIGTAAAFALTIKAVASHEVHFAPGGETLAAAQRDELSDRIVRSKAVCALEVVIVVGHVDPLEAPVSDHIGLSLRRAEYVKRQLVLRGLPAGRVFAEGRGTQEASSVAGSANNRRVAIEAIGAPGRDC